MLFYIWNDGSDCTSSLNRINLTGSIPICQKGMDRWNKEDTHVNLNNRQESNKQLSVVHRRNVLEDQYPTWPRRTVFIHFENVCEKYKQRTFLHVNEASVTYGELWERANVYAKALLKQGVKRRDHIALLMENSPAYPALLIAISLVGAVAVPMNTMLKRDDLSYIIKQSDSRFIIFHEKVKDQYHGNTMIELLADPQFEKESQLEKMICIPEKDDAVDSRFLEWHNFLQSARNVNDFDLEQRREQSKYPDEVAIILYTSGSTGKSKGVMLTHDMLLRCAYSTCLSRAMEDGRVTYGALPFYHCFNIIEGIFALSFVGGTLIAPPRYIPLRALEEMERYKANDFLCVPSMLVPLLHHPRITAFDLSSLYAMWCGAAPAPVPVWKKAMEVLGLTEVITGYGQTEVTSSGVTTEIGESIERISSRVGRPKLGGVCGLPEFNGSTVEYKTIHRDTGVDLPAGEVGELAVRGITVTHGYYNMPEETAKMIDKDGWLRTGDVGRIDEWGYIEMLGRSKELYKVSGELVAPREVEEVISEHPAVNHVYIVGVKDSVTTEAGAAFVELNLGVSCSRRSIMEWSASRIARYKIPRHVWFVQAEEWPMTSTGKVQKIKLQEIAEQKLLQLKQSSRREE